MKTFLGDATQGESRSTLRPSSRFTAARRAAFAGPVLILTVSYDAESLNRQLRDLEKAGHVIVPSSSLETCLNAMVMGAYQVLVIGITVPLVDRERMASMSRKLRPEALIISIERLDAPNLEEADFCIPANEEHRLSQIISDVS